MNKTQIVKINSGEIIASMNGERFFCDIRGSIKKDFKLCVGDYVETIMNPNSNNRLIITKILPRKNQLIRPLVSNIDQMIIVLAVVPKPDLLLVDKLLIYCSLNTIKPVIVVNKCDLDNQAFINDLMNQYKGIAEFVITSGKKLIGIDGLKMILSNKLSVFAGQSAVGKSTLLNAIIPKTDQETGSLSKKIERGKNTTRITEIFENEKIKIADTPGFSMLELKGITPKNLQDFYLDIKMYAGCKFSDCCHINTKSSVCGVRKALDEGKINSDRFDRYVKLYNDLLDKWRNQYD